MIRVKNYLLVSCIFAGIISGVLLLINLENGDFSSLLPVIFNGNEEDDDDDDDTNQETNQGPSPPRGKNRQEIYGIINTFPQSSKGSWVSETEHYTFDQKLKGTWQIDGQTYIANEETIYQNTKGVFKVGSCVKFDIYLGFNTLLRVRTQEPEECSGEAAFELNSALVEKAPDGLYGSWVIGGKEFFTNKETKFEADDIRQFDCVNIDYMPKSGLIVEIDSKWDLRCYDFD
ncbi:DUF5666 domain-containing protein [Crocosphaera sp.]|uniref:DUF5666 domain-containing protein n=1 Tax=Crocosphaera sp. TaxID=2729996 RepID=UPI003F236139|nr:hypothetical protein [Crocosphaera sp.]